LNCRTQRAHDEKPVTLQKKKKKKKKNPWLSYTGAELLFFNQKIECDNPEEMLTSDCRTAGLPE